MFHLHLLNSQARSVYEKRFNLTLVTRKVNLVYMLSKEKGKGRPIDVLMTGEVYRAEDKTRIRSVHI